MSPRLMEEGGEQLNTTLLHSQGGDGVPHGNFGSLPFFQDETTKCDLVCVVFIFVLTRFRITELCGWRDRKGLLNLLSGFRVVLRGWV